VEVERRWGFLFKTFCHAFTWGILGINITWATLTGHRDLLKDTCSCGSRSQKRYVINYQCFMEEQNKKPKWGRFTTSAHRIPLMEDVGFPEWTGGRRSRICSIRLWAGTENSDALRWFAQVKWILAGASIMPKWCYAADGGFCEKTKYYLIAANLKQRLMKWRISAAHLEDGHSEVFAEIWSINNIWMVKLQPNGHSGNAYNFSVKSYWGWLVRHTKDLINEAVSCFWSLKWLCGSRRD
jgi:hypothetical protein